MCLISLQILCVCVLIAVAFAAPPNKGGAVPQIVKLDIVPNNGDGSYYFVYETSDAQRREEKGEFKKSAKEGEGILSVRGSYAFVLPDGKVMEVQYMADENGYRQFIKGQGGKPLGPPGVQKKTRIGGATIASLVGGGLG